MKERENGGMNMKFSKFRPCTSMAHNKKNISKMENEGTKRSRGEREGSSLASSRVENDAADLMSKLLSAFECVCKCVCVCVCLSQCVCYLDRLTS